MAAESSYLVNPYSDPVLVKVNGKASFLNSGPIKDLFNVLVEQGRERYVIDFQNCSGMDSTFLGILAGLGIQLRRRGSKGSVVLCRLGTRNLELIQNLGLHRLLTVDEGGELPVGEDTSALQVLPKGAPLSELENARMVLKAHENLVEMDAANQAKFQDVISFLKNQVDS